MVILWVKYSIQITTRVHDKITGNTLFTAENMTYFHISLI